MCSNSQTALHIKEQVAECLGNGEVKDASSLQLLTEKRMELKNEESLESLENQEELYVCLPINDTEWEPLDIVSLETSMAE